MSTKSDVKSTAKYFCIQRYFDNGHTVARVGKKYENDGIEEGYKSFTGYDQYIDIFDNKGAAERCRIDTLNA